MKKISLFLCLLMITMTFTLSGCVSAEKCLSDVEAGIYESDIEAIENIIQKQYISCEDLTKYYLDRIEEMNDDYNCFITMCDDAIEVARERDAELAEGKGDGMLFGLPVVIKDNMDYVGYETTNGHAKGSGKVATKNAYVVQRLLDEGAIIIGKTNMATEAESAINSYSEAVGDTKNALNPECSPGGSSGGTAVAVALNFAVAGLGTDTNSSLRIPAAFNGDVSMRSTHGLVDISGIVPLNEIRDVAGAITRKVKDNAIMLDVLTDNKYEYGDNLNKKALKGAKIGVIKELSYKKFIMSGDIEFDEDAIELYNKALDELREAGAELVDVSLPVYEYYQLCWDNSGQKYRDEFYSIFKSVMKENDLDAMVYADCLSSEMYLDKPETMDFIDAAEYIAPAIGVPDMTVQIGNLPSGIGVGMGIVADRNEEQKVFDLAYSYENK